MKSLSLKKRHKIFLGIILFFAIVLFAAPRFGRWYIVRHSHELAGRKLEIEKIRINYFTGTLRIYGVKLYESDSQTIFVSFNRLRVNLDYLPLFKNEIFVRNITLDDPFAEVLQKNDKFNFSDLTAGDTAKVVKDTIHSQPMKYVINNIRINRGYVKYTDQVLNHTIALNKLDLLIPGFTWNSDSTNLDVNFRFVDGGGLYSSLELNQADSTYSVNLKLDSLNLNIIEPYVKSNLNISSLHGYLSNDIKIKGNMRSVMQLFVSGTNHVFDFSMTDTLNRKILSFKDFTVDIKALQPDKNIVSLNSVSLTDPVILFEMIDSTNNWMALMKPTVSNPADTTHQQPDSTNSSTHGSYAFSKFVISGGKIAFSDKTLRYPFDYSIDNLKIESTPVAGNPDKFNFSLNAGLNSTGLLEMKGILNTSNYNDMDLSVLISQFRMKDVDAYFRHYFGFPVTGGIMNFKTENKIRPKSLLSDNSLYFRKFTLAKAAGTKVEYHIPLRLALGILSDKDGIIDLKAPVETKGEEIKVRNLGKIILKIIGNLFVKAAVSPFKLLSAGYKVDPAELQDIRLGLMEPSPDEKNLKSVDIIADILGKKPALNIDFFYCSDRRKTIDSLAYILTLDSFLKAKKNNFNPVNKVADSTLISYLLTQPGVAKTDTTMKGLCRNFIGIAKLESKIDSIKQLQINFLTNYLSHDKELSAGRFKIVPVAPDTIKPSGNYPAFRAYFTAGDEKQE
jgi:hypothetical protein